MIETRRNIEIFVMLNEVKHLTEIFKENRSEASMDNTTRCFAALNMT